MCSDYFKSTGNAEPYLRRIADAGFDGIQWIHQWNTDFLYTRPEVMQIKKMLKDFNLRLFDLHGTDGNEKKWYSETEYQRLAGVEIAKNRIEITKELGGNVVVMHVPRRIPENDLKWKQLEMSLDELEPFALKKEIKIAIENIFHDEFDGIGELMKEYSPDFLGVCYDSGHGNMGKLGLPRIAKFADRLIALHLHDNNGYDDQHMPLFSGVADWERLAGIIAESPYRGPITLETIIANSGFSDERLFLAQARADAEKFAGMIEKGRKHF